MAPVEDARRRRRIGRLVTGGVGALVVAYLAAIGLTFAGAPVVGHLSPTRVDELAGPGGDGLGPGAQESPFPPPAAATTDAPPSGAAGGATPTAPGSEGAAGPPGASATTAATASSTTTTTAPAQGTATSVPAPSEEPPSRTHPTGGPPSEPPGKP